MNLLAAAAISGPQIDWMAISPLVALTGGVVHRADGRACCARRFVRHIARAAAHARRRSARRSGSPIATWGDNVSVIAGAMAMDDLTLFLTLPVLRGGRGAACCSSWRGIAPREAGHGEFHALLLTVVLGMVVLAGATNLVTVFIGYELLSIPLYVLCATEMRRGDSLESGLKYLIIGSVGSATLLYGLAFVYGATGATELRRGRRRASRRRAATCCC